MVRGSSSIVIPDSTDESEIRRNAGEDFAALVEAEYESCMRFAMRMLRHRADAEDAVQEAFLRAVQSRDRYDTTRSFHAWLFHILVNQCRTASLQRIRKSKRFSSESDHELDAPDLGVGPDATDEPLLRAVAAALNTLEPLLREAFLLKYVEEMDYVMMSGVTGASISALKMRVKRATDLVRPQLEELHND
jgi:RNA polymerase sigma-70 factor, ECF subfamily